MEERKVRTERRKQEAEQEAAALKEAEGVLGVCCDWGVFFHVRRKLLPA